MQATKFTLIIKFELFSKSMKKSELISMIPMIPKIALLADDRCLVKKSKKWYRAAGTGTWLADTAAAAERRPPAAAVISWFSVLQMIIHR